MKKETAQSSQKVAIYENIEGLCMLQEEMLKMEEIKKIQYIGNTRHDKNMYSMIVIYVTELNLLKNLLLVFFRESTHE